MKNNIKKASLAIGLIITAVATTAVQAQTDAAKRVLERDGALSKAVTLDLCVDYSTLKTDEERKLYIKELIYALN